MTRAASQHWDTSKEGSCRRPAAFVGREGFLQKGCGPWWITWAGWLPGQQGEKTLLEVRVGQGYWACIQTLPEATEEKGWSLQSPLHPAACLRSGQWAGLGACTPHTSNGFCNRQHPCLGSASPVALALGGSEINGGGSTFPSTRSTLSSSHGDRRRRGKWASVFPLPGKHINKDLTWDFPQRILRTTGP